MHKEKALPRQSSRRASSRMVLVLTAIMQRRMEKWRTCSTVWVFLQLELELILGAGFPSSHLSHLHTAEVVVQ